MKWGVACCVLFTIVAWQTKNTSFQPMDAKSFINEMQKQFAEIQVIKQKEDHKEELENKIKEAHRILMKNYPVYYDWWLQDGRNVNWFKGSFSQQLSRRLGELNLATNVAETHESIEIAFQSYLKACEKRRAKRLASFTTDQPEIVFTKFRTL